MNYYEILRVSPDAPPEVIQAAYRALIKKYHPDTNRSPNAAEFTHQLNEAYSVLSDAERRIRYDSELLYKFNSANPQNSKYTQDHKYESGRKARDSEQTNGATTQPSAKKPMPVILASVFFISLSIFVYGLINSSGGHSASQSKSTAPPKSQAEESDSSQASNNSGSATPASDIKSTVTPIQSEKSEATGANGETRIQLEPDGGTYVAPVTINDAVRLKFTVDSGAADVSVPADVFSTLVRAGTITRSDILDEQTYVTADGSTHRAHQFIIRSIRIGDLEIVNVRASVAEGNLSTPMLLGQSFLGRFKSWSVDNTTHQLVLK